MLLPLFALVNWVAVSNLTSQNCHFSWQRLGMLTLVLVGKIAFQNCHIFCRKYDGFGNG
jgi:hypothetical protein